jgi:hypothetical protein
MARYEAASNNTYYSVGDRLYALASLPALYALTRFISLFGHHVWTKALQIVIGLDILHALWIIVIGQENHDPD